MSKKSKLNKLEKTVLDDVRYINLNGDIINYTISKDGTVFNVSTKSEISQFKCSSGKYKAVHLIVNGKDYKRMVHRLVAQAFIPNPENKPQVNHKDNNTFNNKSDNLEWVTPKENIQHMIKSGHQVVGINHKHSKFSECQIHQVCKMLENSKITFSDISKKTNVGMKTIKNIRSGKGWPHISKGYNIIRDIRHQGQSFSDESRKVIKLVKDGKSNSDILLELGLSGTSSKKKLKSVKDKIYYIRKTLKLVKHSTTIEPLP